MDSSWTSKTKCLHVVLMTTFFGGWTWKLSVVLLFTFLSGVWLRSARECARARWGVDMNESYLVDNCIFCSSNGLEPTLTQYAWLLWYSVEMSRVVGTSVSGSEFTVWETTGSRHSATLVCKNKENKRSKINEVAATTQTSWFETKRKIENSCQKLFPLVHQENQHDLVSTEAGGGGTHQRT